MLKCRIFRDPFDQRIMSPEINGNKHVALILMGLVALMINSRKSRAKTSASAPVDRSALQTISDQQEHLPKQIDAVKSELRREIGIDSRDKWD